MSKKRTAHFIVGFNNWGKTTVIFELFGKTRFYYDYDYPIHGINPSARFIVQSQSNDDVGLDFIRRVGLRITGTKKRSPDLVAALCPSMETWNDFTQIISDPTFSVFDEFHFYLLKYKWEHHAELIPNEIRKTYGKTRANSHFHLIDEGSIPITQRTSEKVRQIKNILASIYP